MDNFIEYCKNGDLEAVKQFVDQGCDPQALNNYAIQYASKNGHVEIVKYLIKQGCDPTALNNWAIQSASVGGHLEIVKYLVSVGCDPQAYNNFAIRWASYYGHLEVVKYLFKIGCDHEIVDKSIKYEVLQELKIKLELLLNKKIENKYLKMEILKLVLPKFREYEIMSII